MLGFMHCCFVAFDQYCCVFLPQLQDNLTLGQQDVINDAQVVIRVNFQGNNLARFGIDH